MNSHPVVAAAHELQPLIRKHLLAGEKRARVVQEVVTAVGQAGLFRMFAPREVGGLEVPPSVAFAATEIVSAADPAVGWYIVNSTPACLVAGSLPENARTDVFADPNHNFGFSAAPAGRGIPTTGGYRVSGTWPVVTGCEDAGWCLLAGLVMDGGAPRQMNGGPDGRLFLIPTSALTIAPTWQDAAVMQGTGSNEASVQDVFVPEAFAYSPAQPTLIDRPHFRPPMPVFGYPLNAAVVLGVSGAALESGVNAIGSKVGSISGQTLRDQQPIQELVANCDAALRAARAGVLAALDAVWDLASTGADIPMKLRAQLYASLFYTADIARDTVSRLYARGTRAAFMKNHPLERALRNQHALAFAYEAVRSFQHSAGRVLLGGEPLTPVF